MTRSFVEPDSVRSPAVCRGSKVTQVLAVLVIEFILVIFRLDFLFKFDSLIGQLIGPNLNYRTSK